MVVGLYSVRDIKMGTFSPPACFANEAVATRFIKDQVQRDTEFGHFAEDKELWFLGDFDTNSGKFEQGQEGLRFILKFSDFLILKGKNEDKN